LAVVPSVTILIVQVTTISSLTLKIGSVPSVIPSYGITTGRCAKQITNSSYPISLPFPCPLTMNVVFATILPTAGKLM
jgi:hypothetical protein